MSLQPTPTVLISPKNEVLLLGIIHYFKYRNLFEVSSTEYILVVYRIQGHSNTLFQQHKRRLYTYSWTSPCGQYRNQIDYYILCSQRWRSSMQSAKTRLGADYGSDHELLLGKFSSVSQSCPTLCEPMNRSTPGLPVHHQLPEFTQAYAHCVSDAIQPSHPLSSPSAPASVFFNIVVFSNESALRIRWPKYWSFSFSISHFNEHPGLISFRMD